MGKYSYQFIEFVLFYLSLILFYIYFFNVSYKLGYIILEDAKRWFNDVLKLVGWFPDDVSMLIDYLYYSITLYITTYFNFLHVDMALHFLWAQATKYPKSFGGS